MHEINHSLQQLPDHLNAEVVAHAGNTTGLTPAELVARYRWAAESVIARKRASYVPSIPDHVLTGFMSRTEIENMANRVVPPGLENDPVWRDTHTMLMREVIRFLRAFVDDLAPAQRRREQEAHQQAAWAAQEAARQIAQRQADEEAARQRAQQQVEEAARQLAKRQAEEAAARKLAHEQAEAEARAFAQRKAQEAALQEARLALELAAAATTRMQPETVEIEAVPGRLATEPAPAQQIRFMPGPAATAEIERATLELKHSIDAAVDRFASAIGPYLQPSTQGAAAPAH